MKRALFALLVLLAAAESSAQGDFVVNYRGLMAGRALVTNGFVDFYRTDTAYRVRLQGPTGLAANRTFTLPPNLGSSGQALTTDGAGAMSWASFLESSAIGSTVQAYDADLAALAGLSTSANQCSYWTGAGAAALTSCTAAGRSMIGAADAAAQTALLSAFTGDSGAGGVKGLVPAPSSGDSGKFLKGDGTWGAAASGITHNSTTTNSCAAGGIVRSTSNLADCGAGLTYASGTLTTSGDFVLGASGSAATLRFVNSNQYLLTNVGDGSMELGGGGLTIRSSLNTRVPLLVKPGVSGGTANIQNWADYSGNIFHSVASTGAFSIGSSSLGSTVVPLTARLGTGSTANVFEMQNAAGTILSRFDSAGGLNVASTTIAGGTGETTVVGTFHVSGYTAVPNAAVSQSFAYTYAGEPMFGMIRTANTANQRSWAMGVGAGSTFSIFAINDAHTASSVGLRLTGTSSAMTSMEVGTPELQMGFDVNGSAVDQTIKAHDGITGTNISGADLTIAAGRGTGTGSGGVLKFQTAPVGSSGTTAQTLVDRMTIAKDGTVAIGASLNVGTSGGYYSRLYSSGSAISGITTTSTYNVIESGTSDILFANNGGGAYIGRVTNAGLWNLGSSAIPTAKFEVQGVTGTTVAATINNGTSTGNILNLQDNGTNVFTVADGGNVNIVSGLLQIGGVTAISTTATSNWYLGGAGGTAGGIQNVGVGLGALASNSSLYNACVGYRCFYSIGASGHLNTGLGHQAGYFVSTGDENTIIGENAGLHVTSGSSNTIVGMTGGWGISTGSDNTVVGANVTGLAAGLEANVILADGNGQQRIRQFSPLALTEAGGAETVLTLTSTTTNAFTVNVDYMVKASDATPDYAVRNGSVLLACVNNATVVTCTASATDQTNDGRNGGGSILINTNAKTLTYAITVDVSAANVAVLQFNIDSDMTVTAANITMTVTINGIVTPS